MTSSAASTPYADWQELVRRNTGLAWTTARVMFRATAQYMQLDLDDFIGAAQLGLCKAAQRFDPGRGVQFQSYAIAMIRGAILEQTRTCSLYPRSLVDKLRREGLPPPLQPRSLDGPAQSRDNVYSRSASRSATVGDLIPDDSPGPEELAEASQASRLLAKAVDRLPDRECDVLSLYYFEGLTFKAIGEVLGISESRAYQLHGQALHRLQKDGALREMFFQDEALDDVLCDRPGEV